MTGSDGLRTMAGAMRAGHVGVLLTVAWVGGACFLAPGNTNRWFAWTIEPPITAAYLAGGYLAAVAALALCLQRGRPWVASRTLIVSFPTAVGLLLVVTALHFERFHMDGVTGWLWLLTYAAGPALFPVMLWRQRRAPGADPPRAEPIPAQLRLALAALAALLSALGLTLLLATGVRAAWPWPLTPLAAQAYGALLISQAALTLQAWWEADLRRARAAFVYLAVDGLLHLLALAVHAGAVLDARAAGVLVALDASVMTIGLYGLVLSHAATSPVPARQHA